MRPRHSAAQPQITPYHLTQAASFGVLALLATLFGAWEANWLAYNFAHDIALPGSKGPRLGFLMYPQAETPGLRLDCLDPDTFKYTIRAKELTPA